MPNHGKEKSCSDKETGDGAIGENNLRTHHKSRPRERMCHHALLATTMRNLNDSDGQPARCLSEWHRPSERCMGAHESIQETAKFECVAKMQSKAKEWEDGGLRGWLQSKANEWEDGGLRGLLPPAFRHQEL